ncbi:MAG TPA: DUF4349 domain-containing protein [Solirubrobacteraceae bacterium]|jgi:hypothetical protein|nr:DUF4349 domain-containing protein [Solirubrobacteraceae bacterium]
MRPREDELIDPEIAEQLDAIDATLAGEPVAPRFAELAELALLLSVARPDGPSPEFAAELDGRVEGRFGRSVGAPVDSGGSVAAAGGWSRRWRAWSLTPVLGTAATALAAVVVVAVVLVNSGGGTGTPQDVARTFNGAVTSSPSSKARGAVKAAPVPKRVPVGQVVNSARSLVPHSAAQTATKINGSASSASSASSSTPGGGGAAGGAGTILGPLAAPAPVPNGRKVVQSSILQLGAAANRIDAVAQGVFNVVGAVNGIVDRSNVASTGGPGASAQFQLRVPSASLSLALTDLSRLRYAHVISRTDNTHDVNSSYVSTQHQIAQAQAALARLRTELAGATVQTEIDTLRAQIANENATLARAQNALLGLNHQVSYSRLQVSIQATSPGAGGVTPGAGNGGFGLHKAGHDALRVLEVSAGVVLIALAVLVPVGLLAALAWWLSGTVQRRRRERALDMA